VGVADLVPTRCAICGTTGNATEIYPASFRPDDLNPVVFSARRSPDRVHYRMVRCHTCALVRSDPVAGPDTLLRLYQESSFDYGDEVGNLRATYGRYLTRLQRCCGPGASLLEVGCGNGFALQEALVRGFATIRGVEPSTAAVAGAADEVRTFIICDVMRPGLLEPAQFDAISLFQMFDHVPDPGGLLEDCWAALKPGGHILILNHNVEAVSAKVLRGRSPIIDIEHTYLYSPATLARICQAHRFEIQEHGNVWNRARIGYLARLAPLPPTLRRAAAATCDATGLGHFSLPLPVGNLYVIARKIGGGTLSGGTTPVVAG
jgi:SAM-dependent methyltransferase